MPADEGNLTARSSRVEGNVRGFDEVEKGQRRLIEEASQRGAATVLNNVAVRACYMGIRIASVGYCKCATEGRRDRRDGRRSEVWNRQEFSPVKATWLSSATETTFRDHTDLDSTYERNHNSRKFPEVVKFPVVVLSNWGEGRLGDAPNVTLAYTVIVDRRRRVEPSSVIEGLLTVSQEGLNVVWKGEGLWLRLLGEEGTASRFTKKLPLQY